jgi:hypothetical protein
MLSNPGLPTATDMPDNRMASPPARSIPLRMPGAASPGAPLRGGDNTPVLPGGDAPITFTASRAGSNSNARSPQIPTAPGGSRSGGVTPTVKPSGVLPPTMSVNNPSVLGTVQNTAQPPANPATGTFAPGSSSLGGNINAPTTPKPVLAQTPTLSESPTIQPAALRSGLTPSTPTNVVSELTQDTQNGSSGAGKLRDTSAPRKATLSYSADSALALTDVAGKSKPFESLSHFYDPDSNRTYVLGAESGLHALDPGRLNAFYDAGSKQTYVSVPINPRSTAPNAQSLVPFGRGDNTKGRLSTSTGAPEFPPLTLRISLRPASDTRTPSVARRSCAANILLLIPR